MRRTPQLPEQLLSSLLKLSIRFYRQFISPLTPPSCRYYPTCSMYAMQAINRFGPADGGWVALKRICRCHPWGGAGYDPVPHFLWQKMKFYPCITQHSPDNLYNVPFLVTVRP